MALPGKLPCYSCLLGYQKPIFVGLSSLLPEIESEEKFIIFLLSSFLKKIIYLSDRELGGEGNNFDLPAMAGTGLYQSWEPETPSRALLRVAGTQSLLPSLLLPRVHINRKLESNQARDQTQAL